MALFSLSTASLVMTECTCASLIFTSFNDVPPLVCVDPKYLNLSTSSNTFPYIHILADLPWFEFDAIDYPVFEKFCKT